MDVVSFTLHAANLALIGLLPRVFFRRGRLNLRWWGTASPFLIASAGLVLDRLGSEWILRLGDPTLDAVRVVVATLVACASITLMAFTLGTHRIPISLWHQDDDAPRSIVTWGAYARIRHPFYASFLLALTGALVASPSPLTAFALPLAWLILDGTARREERRLCDSEFGAAYRVYMTQTGRFVPHPGKRAT